MWNRIIPVFYEEWVKDGRKQDLKIFLQTKGYTLKQDGLYLSGKAFLSNELLSQPALKKLKFNG